MSAKVKLLCEQKELDSWYQDEISYAKEEKDLTLKILDIANELNLIDKLLNLINVKKIYTRNVSLPVR